MSSLSMRWKRLWAGRGLNGDDPHKALVRPVAERDLGEGSASETGFVVDGGGGLVAAPAISATSETTDPGDSDGARLATAERAVPVGLGPGLGEGRGSARHGGDVLRADRLWYARPSGDDEEAVLIIGFDLGTSTSKIIVHAPSLEARFLAEQETDSAHEGPAWLWPSALTVDDGGNCALGGASSGGMLRGIKLDLMDVAACGEDATADCSAAGAAVTAYLALVLRAVRSQILVKQADVFRRHATVRWSLNLGVPSGLNEDDRTEDLRIRRLFLQAVTAGWHLSLRAEPIRLKDAETAFLRCGGVGADEVVDVAGTEIAVFPEVIAGVVRYDRSDARRDGLHLAVDVGAATVDVCLFDLPTKSDAPWPLLEARVKRLGVAELHGRRVATLTGIDPEGVRKLERSYDPLSGMAVDPGIPSSSPGFSQIVTMERQMRMEISGLVGGLVQEGKTKRAPNALGFLPEGGIPTLVMGGGSRAEFYRRALRESGERFAEKLGERHRGLEILDAPVPDDLQGNAGRMAYRLGVAVGLSELNLNLPEILRPGDMDDVVTPRAERRLGPSVEKEHT